MLQLINRQLRGQGTIEPVALEARFNLARVLRLVVIDRRRRRVHRNGAAPTVRRVALAVRGVQALARHRLPDHTHAGAGGAALVTALKPRHVVGGMELEPVVAHAQQHFPLFGQADQILQVHRLGFTLVAIVLRWCHTGWACRPCSRIGIERIVRERAGHRAIHLGATQLLAKLHPHQQIVSDAARIELARQIHGVGGGAIDSLLPSVAGPDQTRGCVVGAPKVVVKILIGLALAGHPAHAPLVIEVVAQVRAGHLQLVLHIVTRVLKARADGHPGWHGLIGWPTVWHAPDVVIGVLPRPAQPVTHIDQDAGRDHLVLVANAIAKAVRLLTIRRHTHHHVGADHMVDVDGAAHVFPGTATQHHTAFAIKARLLAHHVDDAAATSTAIQHRARAFQNLNTFHIGRAAAHLPRFTDTVAVNVPRICTETTNHHAFTAHVVGGVHARHPIQHDRQVIDAVALVLVDFQRIDGLRNVFGRHVGFGRRGHALRAHIVRIVFGGFHLNDRQCSSLLLRHLLCLSQALRPQQQHRHYHGPQPSHLALASALIQDLFVAPHHVFPLGFDSP